MTDEERIEIESKEEYDKVQKDLLSKGYKWILSQIENDREKVIEYNERLKKENAELKERIKEVENDSNNCEHWSYTRIKELEKENEQLKINNEQLKQDLKQCSKSLVQIKLEIEKKSKIWKYFESRFVEVCKTCSVEEKAKCIMFPEYCEGNCKEFVDLEALLSKACDDSHIS